MKKITLFDGSVIEGEIGYDSILGWQIPSNIIDVEFEDGTILINPNFVEPE